MSLYDDFKSQGSNEVLSDNNIEVKNELYSVINTPFYKRKEFIVLLCVLLLTSAVLFMFIYTPKFEMEKLTGKTENYVKAYSDRYDLVLTIKEEFDDKAPLDKVFEQSLKAKQEYKEGSVLEVMISKGPNYDKKVKYPDFSSMNLTQTKKWKDSNHVKGLEVVEEFNNDILDGSYIKEDKPQDIANYKRSTASKVYYSVGKKPDANIVVVPDFKKKPISDIALWAKDNGMNYEIIYFFDNYITPGIVTSQDVLAGTKVQKGSLIRVEVCEGPAVTVPNFYGLSAEKAGTLAAEAGVKTSVESFYHGSIATGRLISQSIASGSAVSPKSTVVLSYSLGLVPIGFYQYKTYPDVVAEINKLNENRANIYVDYVYIVTPPEIKKDNKDKPLEYNTVIDNSSKNSLVYPGSTITVYLANGE